MIADSISPQGHRLSTMEVVIPRFILSEFNTHRVFSRNSASSRAIRVAVSIGRVLFDPYVPKRFGLNQGGMQSSNYVNEGEQGYLEAKQAWLWSRDAAVISALSMLVGHKAVEDIRNDFQRFGVLDPDKALEVAEDYDRRFKAKELTESDLNIHKQFVNRLLENWAWQTILVTATEWGNFFALRTHQDAQDQIAIPARLMQEAYESSNPTLLKQGQWHLPLVRPEEMDEAKQDTEKWKKVSTGRSARVSYLTHDGKRDPEADVRLFNRLQSGGHLSPFEHPATPSGDDEFYGNLRGWKSYRKFFDNESDYSAVLEESEKE